MKMRLWEVRTSKNISIPQLAKLSGISETKLKRMEQEAPKYYPNTLELEKIAIVLDVYIEDLLISPRIRNVNGKR